MIRLLVGLGNPGPEYEATRHNAGFWWIDEAARALRTSLTPERSYFGLVARVNRPIPGAPDVDGPVWLLEPMTYMNLSGKAVSALARFFKIAPDEILVAHDELDLLPGQTKIKRGGSHAGHNGLKDIQAQLGTADFWRLRLGIGHPGVRAEVIDYVLRKPAPDHRVAIEAGMAQSLRALPQLLAGDMDAALMTIHAKPPRPRPEKPPKPPKPMPADPTAATAGEPPKEPSA